MSSLTVYEIDILISKYKNLIDSCDDPQKRKEYNYRLLSLKRELDYASKDSELDTTQAESRNSTNIKIISKNILSSLGFNYNSLYHKEVEVISQIFCDRFNWGKTHSEYSNELISLCIIVSVLDYYNVLYNEIDLVSEYDINVDKFFKMSIYIDIWLKDNYWKPRLCLS